MAVKFQQEYARFIVERGVGAQDVIASSPDSYLKKDMLQKANISKLLAVPVQPESNSPWLCCAPNLPQM